VSVPNHHLRQAREQRGWSQTVLAKALGTEVSTIEGWEQGLQLPSSLQQEALCRLFGMLPQHLGFPTAAGDQKQSIGVSFLLRPYASTMLFPLIGESSHLATGIYDPGLPLPSLYANELIGRSKLLQQCRQQLLAYHSLAFYGLPGIGKTALAVALAHDNEVRAQFCDGILWAALGVHPNVAGILQHWGMLLGVARNEIGIHIPQEDWLQMLRSAVGKRHLLIILDDVWQIDAARALYLDNAGCTYLLTTRFAPVATRYQAIHKAIRVPELTENEGVKLLARFAPEVVQDERDTALTLAQKVGGHPLALTLMGKYLGSYSYTKQPRRVRTALGHLYHAERRLQLSITPAPLERPSPLPEGVDISIQSALAVSYLHLPSAAQLALRAFAVLPTKPARVTQQAALAITGATIEELNTLCNAGLLEQSSSTDYMIHTIVADYAHAQGPVPDACARLARYGIDFITSHIGDVTALARESTIILTALEKAWKLEWQAELIQSSCLIATFLLPYGWYPQAEQVLRRALLAATQSDDQQGQVRMLEYLSSLAHLQGDYAQARTYAQKGLALAYQLGEPSHTSRLLTTLGVVTYEQGDYAQAQAYYQEGLALARQLDDQEQIGILLKNLGVVAKKYGDYVRAEADYQESLALARQIGHSDLISSLLMNLGVIANERGDYAQAEAYYREGLDLARRLQHRERICVLLSNLGVVADARGDYAQAETFLREGLSLARQLGHRERLSLLLLNLGVVANRQGKDAQAATFFQEGLSLARQLGHRERISLFLLNLGDLALEQNQLARAEAYLQEGLVLARQIGHSERISDLLLRRGTLAVKQHALAQAAADYQEGLMLAQHIGLPQLICRLLAAKGDLFLQLQQKEAAAEAFHEMLALAPVGNQALRAHAEFGLARVAAARGQFKEARILAMSSEATFEAVGHRQSSVVRDFLESLKSGHR
jgi:tetratricopeptide (TPR) repeat protein/transcriptional regulator with XRE-family HTH domain